MGSIPGRVGVNGPEISFTFTAAGQDSGVLGVIPAVSAKYPPLRLWPYGWEKFSFQLLGTGTGYAITVYGTFDQDTAAGNANNWFTLPGNPVDTGIASWSNPMIAGNVNASALEVRTKLLAVRATSDLALGSSSVTGTITLSVGVSS